MNPDLPLGSELGDLLEQNLYYPVQVTNFSPLKTGLLLPSRGCRGLEDVCGVGLDTHTFALVGTRRPPILEIASSLAGSPEPRLRHPSFQLIECSGTSVCLSLLGFKV